MTTFITTLDGPGAGPRLAVKDLIDVAGVPTTAGSRAVERAAGPATADACLLDDSPDDLGEDITQMLAMAPLFRDGLADAQAQLPRWRRSLLDLFGQVELLALPTLPIFPPTIEAVRGDGFLQAITDLARHVAPFNPAGVPCTAQPVAAEGSAVPASLQLVGPPDGEELLVATAARIEAALA